MLILNNAPNVPKPVGAYSQAVDAGGLLFCSGQIGIDPDTGEMVGETVEEQTKQVLKNIQALLTFSGSQMDRIVMTTIFLSDISHGKIVNELYGAAVDPNQPPARQTVAVKDLPLGALVEISVIAIKG